MNRALTAGLGYFVRAMFTPADAIGLAGQVVFGLMPLLLRTPQAGRG